MSNLNHVKFFFLGICTVWLIKKSNTTTWYSWMQMAPKMTLHLGIVLDLNDRFWIWVRGTFSMESCYNPLASFLKWDYVSYAEKWLRLAIRGLTFLSFFETLLSQLLVFIDFFTLLCQYKHLSLLWWLSFKLSLKLTANYLCTHPADKEQH